MSDSPGPYADVVKFSVSSPEATPVPVALPEETGLGELPAYQFAGKPGAGVIAPDRLRRLGRTQRLILSAACEAITKADLGDDIREQMAAFIGSGAGESNDTIDFLRNMVLENEDAPKPSKFINSVPSSLSTQLSIELGLKGENATFIHHSISSELALWQALATLNNGRAPYAIAGGVDALEPDLLAVGRRYGWWRENGGRLKPMVGEDRVDGSIPGEGAAAFVLAAPGVYEGERLARISHVRARPILGGMKAFDAEREVRFLGSAMARAGLKLSDVELFVLGANGNKRLDSYYRKVITKLRELVTDHFVFSVFKHRTGEFCGAAAMGLTCAVQSVDEGRVAPGLVAIDPPDAESSAKVVVCYNIYEPGWHSAIVLTR